MRREVAVGPGGKGRRPGYVYVASSWRNPMQPAVCAILTAAGIEHYDFRNPPGGTGFSWREVKSDGGAPSVPAGEVKAKGSDWEARKEYLAMIQHPRAVEGFEADFAAMQRADTFVMVLPCGKSAHLELGWAAGAGKRTAVLLEDPVEPELMYRCADYLSPSVHDLLGWLGGLMKIYLAGPYAAREKIAAYARELETIGFTVTSSWLAETHEISEGTTGAAVAISDEEVAAHAETDLRDLTRSDLVALITEQAAGAGSSSGGRHVETGYAIARDKHVVVVGAPENVFHRAPQRCTCVPDWHAAVVELARRLVEHLGTPAGMIS